MTWTDVQSSSCRQRRAAFTLVELVVVLVIISIVASAAIFSLRRPLQIARLNRAISSLEDADRRARMEAQRSGTIVELIVDPRDNLAQQTTLVDGRRQTESRSLSLSGSQTIDRFMFANGTTVKEQLKVKFAPNGRSATYAIRLKATGNNPQSLQTWLVVVGATGQYVEVNEDSVVEQILQR